MNIKRRSKQMTNYIDEEEIFDEEDTYGIWHMRRRKKKTIDGDEVIYGTTDMDAVLYVDPHYTNEQFRHAQTIFGSREDGLFYEYSDRLWQRDYEKAEKAIDTATASGAKFRTARWYQVYLSAYCGKKIILKHMLAGWNWSTGYAYQVFGYHEEEEKNTD
jgi:hypothetical protein